MITADRNFRPQLTVASVNSSCFFYQGRINCAGFIFIRQEKQTFEIIQIVNTISLTGVLKYLTIAMT